MNLSFAGCGFLGLYHVGVACCFRKYAPHLLLNKISGASAGAIAACCLLLDLPLGKYSLFRHLNGRGQFARLGQSNRPNRTISPYPDNFDVCSKKTSV